MVTRRDYTDEKVEAARSVLLELTHLLGQYREDIVLVGGWVPDLLLNSVEERHVGSIDVDLALNHRRMEEEGYRTIEKLLLERGYKRGSQPFIYYRTVSIGEKYIDIEVDFLAGEYSGTSKTHRHQQFQGIKARKARGCDLAFEIPVDEVFLEGELPDGGKDSATVRIASIVPFLVMKGIALDERLKAKDAYDIYYCVQNYPGGLDALVKRFKPHLHQSLVREGLQKIAKHFSTEKHLGPKSVADFKGITDAEERELLQRDAYEKISYIIELLGIT